jgi:hypothetical protein
MNTRWYTKTVSAILGLVFLAQAAANGVLYLVSEATFRGIVHVRPMLRHCFEKLMKRKAGKRKA